MEKYICIQICTFFYAFLENGKYIPSSYSGLGILPDTRGTRRNGASQGAPLSNKENKQETELQRDKSNNYSVSQVASKKEWLSMKEPLKALLDLSIELDIVII